MKFCSFSALGTRRFGLIPESGTCLDLGKAVAVLGRDGGFPSGSLAGAVSLRSWLELGPAAIEASRRVLDIFSSDPDRLGDVLYTNREYRILAPIRDPGKIIAVGLNYRNHAEEQNAELPERPRLFAKFPSAVIGPEEPIRLPGISRQVDPEAELCMVVLAGGRKISREQAPASVAFMIGNDVSARDLQFSDRQWVRGKSCDTFAPCGPFIATLDEVGDPHDLKIELRRNGEIKQSSSTSRLIFNCWELLEFISETSTLYPGDIIFTGTPSGVGVFRTPPEFLEPGDVVEVTIEKLGTLRNPVVRA